MLTMSEEASISLSCVELVNGGFCLFFWWDVICYLLLQSLVAQEEFQHILRVLNTNVDGKQKIMFALTSIKGIGRRFANIVCKKADVDMNKRFALFSLLFSFGLKMSICCYLYQSHGRAIRKIEYKSFRIEQISVYVLSLFLVRSGSYYLDEWNHFRLCFRRSFELCFHLEVVTGTKSFGLFFLRLCWVLFVAGSIRTIELPVL